ncbi:MAG: radical SAM protein [Steroidobacteraceae bacterium]|nr:radical SAM protein [Deltaproteobacteria bacterium]
MAKIDFSRLYSLLGNLHSLVPFGLGSSRALPPYFVQIEVTHRCNVGCSVCYQKTKLSTNEEMTLEEIKHIVDQLPAWSILSLTGGEPFIREDFAAILEYGLNQKRCTILTNASLVTDSHIELMVRNKLLLMAVSIDGIGDTHDGIRKSAGLFDKAVETIKKVQEKKKTLNTMFPLIDIKTVIQNENLAQLNEILGLADSLSADFITFSLPKLMVNHYAAPYREDIRDIYGAVPSYPTFDDDELELLKRQIQIIREHSGKTAVRFYPSNMLDENTIEKFYRQKLSANNFQSCSAPWSRMSISPHGDAYPCLSYLVGNARRESLSRIWNGPRFREFRKCLERKKLSNFCLGCCNSVCNDIAAEK